jgi:nucleoside transporter
VDPRLSVMMFLQFAVYGLWLPLASRFLSAETSVGGLGFSDTQIGTIIAIAGAVGAIVSPFFAGQIADRHFSTERCLGVLMIFAGVLKFITAYQTTYAAWVALSIGYALVYMPTLSLCNSMAMANLSDSKSQFPKIRVWGTVAWIVVSWVFPMVWLQTDLSFRWLPPFFTGDAVADAPARMVDSFKVSGVLSIGYGIFCWFCLPHTPPKKGAAKRFAFVEAFGLLKIRSFAVLLAVTLPVSVIHFFYFMQTSKFLSARGLDDAYLMPAMSVGQFGEIFVMAFLGKGLTRFGFRKVITVGALSYCVRYLIFSVETVPMGALVAAQFLHGFCFACFFATAFIYVDKVAPSDVRHSAQTLFALVMFGLGPLISGPLNGWLGNAFRSAEGVMNYSGFWLVAAIIAGLSAVVFGFLFREEVNDG